jgi:hypothetical protein
MTSRIFGVPEPFEQLTQDDEVFKGLEAEIEALNDKLNALELLCANLTYAHNEVVGIIIALNNRVDEDLK